MRQYGSVIALLLSVACFLHATDARAEQSYVWSSAKVVQDELFAAQQSLLLADKAQAKSKVKSAERVFKAGIGRDLKQYAPSSYKQLSKLLKEAKDDTQSKGHRSSNLLALRRGEIESQLHRASYYVTLQAASKGKLEQASEWLKLRAFRKPTKFSLPTAEATSALNELKEKKISSSDAQVAIKKDLLSAYQSTVLEHFDEILALSEHSFNRSRSIELAALAEGHWQLLRPAFKEQNGSVSLTRIDTSFDSLVKSAFKGRFIETKVAIDQVKTAFGEFTAAPLTNEELVRTSTLLTKFIDLIPFEYGKGVKGTRVTVPFEIQEAAAFSELQPELKGQSSADIRTVGESLTELKRYIEGAQSSSKVTSKESVEDSSAKALDALDRIYPESWKQGGDDADFDVISFTLDQMEAAVARGEYGQAEAERLGMYAVLEFGPELRLKAIDPSLAAEVEDLIWFGRDEFHGLATLISQAAPYRDVHRTRLELDTLLENSRATLGDGASKATVVTNTAVIVFREGLEAVLILAAVTASLMGSAAVARRQRRSILLGGLLALLGTFITWVLAQSVINSLSRYGEKLEAVVSLIAVAVLLVVMNWFLHKVYWSGWIAKHSKRRRKITSSSVDTGGVLSAQVFGLVMLGFTSIYREGFETVLFLQAIEISAGGLAVLEGVLLGLGATALIAVAMFKLQRKLPYKKMLIITGFMIGLVLVVMVGGMVRTMQGVGWLPIHPIDIDMPYWLGLWFGVFPTWETLGSQLLAAFFVIGSYFAAEKLKTGSFTRRGRAKKGAKMKAMDGVLKTKFEQAE